VYVCRYDGVVCVDEVCAFSVYALTHASSTPSVTQASASTDVGGATVVRVGGGKRRRADGGKLSCLPF
jgi:hypothetical protein